MARYTGPVCRLCRREDMKLFLKGERCFTDKCAYERRAYPPGQHGQGRRKRSDYGEQLREKQKVRRMYGVLEQQFRGYYHKANRAKGVTGENLLALLERRLDNVIYRLGFASTRAEARQLVRHRHFTINGRKANVPSMLLRPGDAVEVKERSRKVVKIVESLAAVDRRGVPSWLELDKEAFKGVVEVNYTRGYLQWCRLPDVPQQVAFRGGEVLCAYTQEPAMENNAFATAKIQTLPSEVSRADAISWIDRPLIANSATSRSAGVSPHSVKCASIRSMNAAEARASPRSASNWR